MTYNEFRANVLKRFEDVKNPEAKEKYMTFIRENEEDIRSFYADGAESFAQTGNEKTAFSGMIASCVNYIEMNS